MKKLFILSYQGVKFLEQNKHINALQNTAIYIVDNGQQTWTTLGDRVIHTTMKNLGCAEGWNLCADIGFQYFREEKIAIVNDDCFYTDFLVDQVFAHTNPTTICGAFNRSFEFSLFGIHANTFATIGRFDANFYPVGGEDDDAKWRCKLEGITVHGLDKDSRANLCLSSRAVTKDQRKANIDYIDAKWGKPRRFTLPFDGKYNTPPPKDWTSKPVHKYAVPPIDAVRAEFDLGDHYPSELEFDAFYTDGMANGFKFPHTCQ